MGLFRFLFDRSRSSEITGERVRLAALPSATPAGHITLPVTLDAASAPLLSNIINLMPAQGWVYVRLSGHLEDEGGSFAAPVLDVHGRRLGVVPLSSLAGSARALSDAQGVVCAARITIDDTGAASLNLDSEFLKRELEERRAAEG